MRQHTIWLVSGGTGASGLQLVRTALAQFEGANVSVAVVPNVRSTPDVTAVIARLADDGDIIVHTLVDRELRETLTDLAHERHVVAVDAIGPLLHHLTRFIGRPPLGQPGRYRQLKEEDLRRIEAIEFSVEHDDGKRADELHMAEIVLVGVSRVGKTPVSMYLATLGWKVANVPIAPEIEPPDELFAVDHRRGVCLRIEPGQLVQYRRRRQQRLGISSLTSYVRPEQLVEELRVADKVCQKGRFASIDMTDKPIEEAADEIIALVRRRLA